MGLGVLVGLEGVGCAVISGVGVAVLVGLLRFGVSVAVAVEGWGCWGSGVRCCLGPLEGGLDWWWPQLADILGCACHVSCVKASAWVYIVDLLLCGLVYHKLERSPVNMVILLRACEMGQILFNNSGQSVPRRPTDLKPFLLLILVDDSILVQKDA